MKNFILFPARAGSLGFFLLFIHILPAQSVQLVKDIWQGSTGSIPITFVDFTLTSEGLARADTFFFTANDGVHGIELWRSDGTEAGTWMVSDINPGSADSRPTWLTLLNNGIVFFARHDAVGLELWYSDGTQTGTYLIKDINPGSGDAVRPGYAPQIRDMVVRDGILYFSADSADVYGQLWRSDGTFEGTYALKSVCPTCTATSRTPGWFSTLGNNVYFISGKDIWKSNGTSAGTTMLVNGEGNNGDPGTFTHLQATGNRLYFAGRGGSSIDVEPYYNNGSSTSATLLKDIGDGSFTGSFPRQFTQFGSKVYFIAEQHLWSTSGSSNSTVEFSTLITGNSSASKGDGRNFLVANNQLFFNARGSSGSQEYLYVTDGNAGNVVQLAPTNDFAFTELGLVQYGQKVCFLGSQGSDAGIWVTNGTSSVFYSTGASNNVMDLWLVGDRLYFFINQLGGNVGMELYQLKLTPDAPLSAGLMQQGSIACNGQSTAGLFLETTGGVPPYTYAWNVNGLSGNNPVNLAAGFYQVTITDAGLNTATQQFSISQPFNVFISLNTTPATVGLSNGSVVLTASGGTPPYTYAWANGDTTSTLNDLLAGTYPVTVTDANGCTKTTQAIVQEVTNVVEIDKSMQWSVFPTPARGWLQIDWTGAPIPDLQAQLLDQRGTVVRHWKSIPQQRLDVSDIPSGIYVLRIQNQQYTGYHRVVLME